MIGQKQLKEQIDNFKDLPHSILLIGDRGSEQDLICEYISEKFNLIQFDLGECLNSDILEEALESHTKTLYTLDLLSASERVQNILLKFYEEPSDYTYIILYAENDTAALETIKNRSYILRTNSYSTEQLERLVANDRDKDLILDICSTPGQVEAANMTNMYALHELCLKILKSMSKANFANALTISNKINFKDEYEKFDLYLFIKVLSYVIKNNLEYSHLYEDLLFLDRYIWQMANKKSFFDLVIINIWTKSRS